MNIIINETIYKLYIQVSNGSLEANLFGETPSTEKSSNVSTKDSIMALFGGGQQTQQQQFGVPGRWAMLLYN